MSDTPEQIRADIERTRSELGSDVDALADKVTPSKIVDREKAKVKGRISSVKDRVLGVVSDASGTASSGLDSASSALGSARDGVAGAPSKVAEKASGSPIAVGLMAFGAGLLLASLIPASEKEKELASSAKDAAQPLIHEATDEIGRAHV